MILPDAVHFKYVCMGVSKRSRGLNMTVVRGHTVCTILGDGFGTAATGFCDFS